MKHLIILSILSFLTFGSKAQSKTITLNELIRSGIPDSSASQNVTDWKKGLSINSKVKWKSNQVKKQVLKGGKTNLITYSKNGSTKVILPNNKTDEISVSLSGNSANGYSEIMIDMSLVDEYNLEKLIGNKNCSIILLKKDGDAYPFYDYKLKFPGKKEVWVMLMPSFPGTMMPDEETSLNIIILFDYKEYLSRK